MFKTGENTMKKIVLFTFALLAPLSAEIVQDKSTATQQQADQQKAAQTQSAQTSFIWKKHLSFLASIGKSPFVIGDSKTGEQPVAVVTLESGEVVKLWKNQSFSMAAAEEAVALTEFYKKQQETQQQAQAASVPQSAAAQTVNSAQLKGELSSFVQQHLGQQVSAPNEVVVKQQQLLDPAYLDILQRQERREDMRDFSDAMHTWSWGMNNMGSGISETIRDSNSFLRDWSKEYFGDVRETIGSFNSYLLFNNRR